MAYSLVGPVHHTTAKAAASIRSSQQFRGSSWNIQGNRNLKNVSYIYFTSLPRITGESDLQAIAIASNGVVELIPTSGKQPDDVIRLTVYRESTVNRRQVPVGRRV